MKDNENGNIDNIEEKVEENTSNDENIESKKCTTTIENIDSDNMKKHKFKIIVCIVSILLVLFFIIMLLIFIGNKKDYIEGNKKIYNDVNKNNEEKNDEINSKVSENKLNVYMNNSADKLCVKDNYCNTIAFAIDITDKNAKVFDVFDFDYVLYLDNEIKVYDVNKKTSTIISIYVHYTDYEFVYYRKDDKNFLLGIAYYNKIEKDDIERISDFGFYNLKLDKIVFENEDYYSINAIDDEYISVYDEENVNLMSTSVNQIYYVETNEGCFPYFETERVSNSKYIIFSNGCFGDRPNILTKEYNKIVAAGKYEYQFDDNGFLYAVVDNKVIKYNDLGEIISTTKKYFNIKQIFYVDDQIYILYIENEKIYITDDMSEPVMIGEFKENYYYHWVLSKYWTKEDLSNHDDGKEAGFYIVVGLPNETGDSFETPGLEYYYNPKTGDTKTYELEYVGGYAKPILYLYPTKTTDVTITFENEDNLTTTYPKYNKSWNVIAHTNGDLYDKNGKYYYGLYWEENSNHDISFDNGFYVTKENAIDFLEEKLSIIGFNERESNEFIMYWLPILEKNERSLVYFELTEERESNSKININPTPDSILRVAIHVKKVNSKINIKEQKLTTFNRKGFTAVEWGGVIH